ncbi:hypothetical protein MK489_24435, partial [Myxococcota bacterium]|nr:hypothetical protein [Myxococcota bacterium]
RSARTALLLAWTALTLGCTATTDQDIYEVGEEAWGSFSNRLPGTTVYLGGCGFFTKEKLMGTKWVDRGSDIICAWEGFARPVEPGESAEQLFLTDETGTWRLAFRFGLFCSENRPMDEQNCRSINLLRSNPYEVIASRAVALCEKTGGVWDPTSCGHWFCGQKPLCKALIPGCNCSKGRLFDTEMGCVESLTCQ